MGIKMTKDKNWLIFNDGEKNIKYDLNEGYFFNDKMKQIAESSAKKFFTGTNYKMIINYDEYPIYSKMILTARKKMGPYYITNMASVLSFLHNYHNLEQYYVLGIPVEFSDRILPIKNIPRDILQIMLRCFKLKNEYREKFCVPGEIEHYFFTMSDVSTNLLYSAIRYAGTFTNDYDFRRHLCLATTYFHDINELIKDYNYEYKALIEYLLYLYDYEGYDEMYYILRELKDYLTMQSKIVKYVGNGKLDKYPHFLKSRHQIAIKTYNALGEKFKESAFQEKYRGEYNYSDSQFCIVEPKCTTDVIKEGFDMHNCVASYIDRICKGNTLVVFMRNRKEQDISLVTVEIREGKICQAFQQCNTPINSEQKDFLKKFAKEKKLILDIL